MTLKKNEKRDAAGNVVEISVDCTICEIGASTRSTSTLGVAVVRAFEKKHAGCEAKTKKRKAAHRNRKRV
jgi:hypothetical protein